MTYTLGIDTSHEVAVGLARDGMPLDAITVPDTRAHAEAVLPTAIELCARHGLTLADIDEYAVGMGPGPFTGLRVGIVTAWTLASARGVAAHGVCSLDVVARQWVRVGGAPSEFVIASDARRKELYWARYDAAGVRLDGPNVTSSDQLPDLPLAGAVPANVGEAKTLPPEIRQSLTYSDTDCRISAGRGPSGGRRPTQLDPAVLAADWGLLARMDEPAYLRAADATVSTRIKSALPRPIARRR